MSSQIGRVLFRGVFIAIATVLRLYALLSTFICLELALYLV